MNQPAQCIYADSAGESVYVLVLQVCRAVADQILQRCRQKLSLLLRA